VSLDGTRYLEEAGLVVAGSPRYYAVLNVRRGGVGVVHTRATGQLAWEDAGYVAGAGGQLWSSALDAGAGVVREGDQASFTIRTRLDLANREVLTPLRFLLLRLANLTLFRSVAAGAAVRRRIIARLITGRRAGSIALTRTIRFWPDRIEIGDRLRRDGGPATEVLARSRAFTPFHMGSTRYFHQRELVELPGVAVTLDARRLDGTGELARRAEIRIEDGGEVRIIDEPVEE
jgi:hypothetical protein